MIEYDARAMATMTLIEKMQSEKEDGEEEEKYIYDIIQMFQRAKGMESDNDA